MKRAFEEEELPEAQKPGLTAKEMEDYARRTSEEQKEEENGGGESEDSDEVILSSRRRQQQWCVRSESESSDVEAPGAPAKKKRRVLPWTEEGRVLWPQAGGMEDDSVVLVEDSQDGVGSEEESEESEEESERSDDRSSFVVDDDSLSVVEEERTSERYLAQAALKEVRVSTAERIEKLRGHLAAVDSQLKRLEASSGSTSSCSSEGAEVVDERTCLTRRDQWCATVDHWEESEPDQ